MADLLFFTLHQSSWGTVTVKAVTRETEHMYFGCDPGGVGVYREHRFKKKECHGKFDTLEAAKNVKFGYEQIHTRHKADIEHHYEQWRTAQRRQSEDQKQFWVSIDNPQVGG